MPQLIGFLELVEVVRQRGSERRSLTAIAGPPGAGKSTLAERLADQLNEADPGSAAILPMDGYHFDDMVLVPRGLRARKGAPETFDVAGFSVMLERLRRNVEPEIAVPVFDRSIEIARAGARMIPDTVRHLIVEGNYILLDVDGWRDLARHYDTTVLIGVAEVELRQRLEDRWKALGAEERAAKIDGNDLPNGRLVIERSQSAEFVLA
jgi:pantothenate kinase